MKRRFEKMFARYEALAGTADRIFEKVEIEFSKEMSCKKGCSDCCHALFDVSLVEALYLNHHFNRRFSGKEKAALIEKAPGDHAPRPGCTIHPCGHQTRSQE